MFMVRLSKVPYKSDLYYQLVSHLCAGSAILHVGFPNKTYPVLFSINQAQLQQLINHQLTYHVLDHKSADFVNNL